MATPFGKYLLQRKLAEGGMAEVFLARQRGMEASRSCVVIKRILPQLCRTTEFVEMFLDEARLAARLIHPNIVADLRPRQASTTSTSSPWSTSTARTCALAQGAPSSRSGRRSALVCRIIADTLGGPALRAHARRRRRQAARPRAPRRVAAERARHLRRRVKLVDFGIAKATRAATPQQTQAGLSRASTRTCRPSRRAASRSTRAPTCSPPASCCGSCSPGSACSAATTIWRRCWPSPRRRSRAPQRRAPTCRRELDRICPGAGAPARRALRRRRRRCAPISRRSSASTAGRRTAVRCSVHARRLRRQAARAGRGHRAAGLRRSTIFSCASSSPPRSPGWTASRCRRCTTTPCTNGRRSCRRSAHRRRRAPRRRSMRSATAPHRCPRTMHRRVGAA